MMLSVCICVIMSGCVWCVVCRLLCVCCCNEGRGGSVVVGWLCGVMLVCEC